MAQRRQRAGGILARPPRLLIRFSRLDQGVVALAPELPILPLQLGFRDAGVDDAAVDEIVAGWKRAPWRHRAATSTPLAAGGSALKPLKARSRIADVPTRSSARIALIEVTRAAMFSRTSRKVSLAIT